MTERLLEIHSSIEQLAEDVERIRARLDGEIDEIASRESELINERDSAEYEASELQCELDEITLNSSELAEWMEDINRMEDNFLVGYCEVDELLSLYRLFRNAISPEGHIPGTKSIVVN